MRLSNRKISTASSANIIVKPVYADTFSCLINSYVKTKACVAVEHAMKTCFDFSFIWKSKAKDQFQSDVRYLQLYSDMSRTSFLASVFVLYPAHVTFPNFTLSIRWRQIV